ncbi:MAG: class I SAM-dependent RNA methyltransferase [Spirochaetales bacterium]|nr:MAG: class I SAM-dependent RNA methyltransferase [Spirochaetales bacterium]
MRIGDEIELAIERIAAGGDGLGFIDGIAAFIPLSAPGDCLRARITETKSDYLRAEILEVVEAASSRIDPPCPLYGRCGGCNLMHMDYQAQIEAKKGVLRDALRRVGSVSETIAIEAEASSPFEYRNRAQFRVTPDGSLGYMQRGSVASIPVPACPILTPALGDWLRVAWNGGGWKERSGYLAGKDRFIAFGTQDRVYLEGRDNEAEASVGGKSFRFPVGGFFQSNLDLLERLVPAVLEGMGGARAADLYSGVGLFGAFLKERFERLACVEQDQRSVGYACRNVGREADFSALGVEAWTRSAQAMADFDYVVVDPPRAGLGPPVRAWLADRRPAVVGYVSCDPVSFARDAGALVRSGYRLDAVRIFDFYPQTSHMESYARFQID